MATKKAIRTKPRKAKKIDTYTATCIITGKVFEDEAAEQHITETALGPVWMGLWDDPKKIQFNQWGHALLPRSWQGRYKVLENADSSHFEECNHPQRIWGSSEVVNRPGLHGGLSIKVHVTCGVCGLEGILTSAVDPDRICWKQPELEP